MSYLVAAGPVVSQADDSTTIQLRQCLVIERIEQPRRSAVHVDAIEAAMVQGTWTTPIDGTELVRPGVKTRSWTAAQADENGWFDDPALGNAYALITVESPADRIALLDARGHSLVYVNGELRAGDPYQYGYVQLPIELRKGTNELLFVCGRGRLWARLLTPRSPIFINTADNTLPDLPVGQAVDEWGSIVVVNATAEPVTGLRLSCRLVAPVEHGLDRDTSTTTRVRDLVGCIGGSV